MDIVHGPFHPGQVPQTRSTRTKVYLDAREGDEEQVLTTNRSDAVASGQTCSTHSCSKCRGWYGQLGLEPTHDLYIRHLVEIFKEVHRVLHPSGTLWVNIGDTYATPVMAKRTPGLKAKDLIGIPFELALALRRDGWYFRNDVVWEKVPFAPESVRDRPSRCHEHILMFSKCPTYFYDKRSPHLLREKARSTVWKLPPTSYRGDHFASFNPDLPATSILLGSSDLGCCSVCLAPRTSSESCSCKDSQTIPCTILDPFTGSGTTLAVAVELGRNYLGVEQNPDYAKQIETKLSKAREGVTARNAFEEAMDLGVD